MQSGVSGSSGNGSQVEPIHGAFQVDAEKVRVHVDEVVRQSVEETLSLLLDQEADQLYDARRYERSAESADTGAAVTPGSCRPRRASWRRRCTGRSSRGGIGLIQGEHAYVYLDGIWLKRSWGGKVKNVAVLVAIGVDRDGFREVLGGGGGREARVDEVGQGGGDRAGRRGGDAVAHGVPA